MTIIKTCLRSLATEGPRAFLSARTLLESYANDLQKERSRRTVTKELAECPLFRLRLNANTANRCDFIAGSCETKSTAKASLLYSRVTSSVNFSDRGRLRKVRRRESTERRIAEL